MAFKIAAIWIDRNGMPGRANPVGFEGNIVFDHNRRVGICVGLIKSPVF